jgi:flagellar biosynthesis protein FlhG
VKNMTLKKLWSIGGGKGGIGKSIFTLGLGITMAQMGKKIILIDADLGGANLHTLMGVRYPAYSLEDFILKRVERLEDIVIETQVEGIGLICGADDIMGAANPKFAQKIRLLNQLEDLPADLVLLDLGAGTSFNVLDFFNYSAGKIAVFTNQSTSLQNVYGFIKSALFRFLSREFTRDEQVLLLLHHVGNRQAKINSIEDILAYLQERAPEKYDRLKNLMNHFEIFLVVNMVKTELDRKAGRIIQKVCTDFLNLQPQLFGSVVYEPEVEKAVNQMLPFPMRHHETPGAMDLQHIALQVLKEANLPEPSAIPKLVATGVWG